ncbi:hypothetical protein ACJIZ3_006340 [Penstemon smallii]|uniref:Protein NUCLEAR FUSION DEFECTIVE 6, chloroplastic/mitochondrial-like n=1 Tax=Penstemon smallii TaxID=265156 RepID=A0ABD3S7Q6_9LAMI
MASVAAARSVLRSARNATSRIPTGFKHKDAPSPFGISSQKPLSARIFRSPMQMSSVSVVSMLPYHNATASALLTSMLSVAPCRHGWTLEGNFRFLKYKHVQLWNSKYLNFSIPFARVPTLKFSVFIFVVELHDLHLIMFEQLACVAVYVVNWCTFVFVNSDVVFICAFYASDS